MEEREEEGRRGRKGSRGVEREEGGGVVRGERTKQNQLCA